MELLNRVLSKMEQGIEKIEDQLEGLETFQLFTKKGWVINMYALTGDLVVLAMGGPPFMLTIFALYIEILLVLLELISKYLPTAAEPAIA